MARASSKPSRRPQAVFAVVALLLLAGLGLLYLAHADALAQAEQAAAGPHASAMVELARAMFNTGMLTLGLAVLALLGTAWAMVRSRQHLRDAMLVAQNTLAVASQHAAAMAEPARLTPMVQQCNQLLQQVAAAVEELEGQTQALLSAAKQLQSSQPADPHMQALLDQATEQVLRRAMNKRGGLGQRE